MLCIYYRTSGWERLTGSTTSSWELELVYNCALVCRWQCHESSTVWWLFPINQGTLCSHRSDFLLRRCWHSSLASQCMSVSEFTGIVSSLFPVGIGPDFGFAWTPRMHCSCYAEPINCVSTYFLVSTNTTQRVRLPKQFMWCWTLSRV